MSQLLVGGITRLTPDSKVAKNILSKDGLEDKKRRILLYGGGGGARGVFSGAFFEVLDKRKLFSKIDVCVGTSVACCNLSYARAGQGEVIVDAFRHLIKDKFYKAWRINKLIDIDYLVEEVFRGKVNKREKLDIEKLQSCPGEFYLTATNVRTGNVNLFDSKIDNLDFMRMLKASVAMPIFYNQPVEIEGGFYMDSCVDLLPLIDCIEKFEPTDVLLVMNESASFMENQSLSDFYYLILKGLTKIFLSKYPVYEKTVLELDKRFRKILAQLSKQTEGESIDFQGRKINLAVACPDGIQGSLFFHDSAILEDLAYQGKNLAEWVFKS